MKQEGLVPSEIANKSPLSSDRAGRSPAAKPGARNPAKLGLPASHHHLDVLPLLIFLLRRWIRLRRHDGSRRKIKAWSRTRAPWGAERLGGRRGPGCPPPLSGAGVAGEIALHQGLWLAPASVLHPPEPSNHQPSIRPKPRKPSNDSAPQFEKGTESPGQLQRRRARHHGTRCRHQIPLPGRGPLESK